MKKFNWGWGIGLFYSAFVVFMLIMVWHASQQKVEMVTADYYNKELAFQGQLDKQRRAAALKEPLHWQVEKNNVYLKFPAGANAGNSKAQVLFYRPGDSSKDFSVNVTPGEDGQCVVSGNKLIKGMYRMQVDWTMLNTAYYNEGVININ